MQTLCLSNTDFLYSQDSYVFVDQQIPYLPIVIYLLKVQISFCKIPQFFRVKSSNKVKLKHFMT